MKKIALSKNVKSNLITYGMVIAAYILVTIFLKAGMVSSLIQGLLVPLCMYVILAVSLNLTVGILGELSLGHAGFMSVGAYASSIVTGFLGNYGLPPVLLFIIAQAYQALLFPTALQVLRIML